MSRLGIKDSKPRKLRPLKPIKVDLAALRKRNPRPKTRRGGRNGAKPLTCEQCPKWKNSWCSIIAGIKSASEPMCVIGRGERRREFVHRYDLTRRAR